MEQDIIILVVSCIMGFAGYRMALWKNRSPWLGVALGFFLGLIGLLIMAVIPRKQGYTDTYTSSTMPDQPLGARYTEKSDAA